MLLCARPSKLHTCTALYLPTLAAPLGCSGPGCTRVLLALRLPAKLHPRLLCAWPAVQFGTPTWLAPHYRVIVPLEDFHHSLVRQA